jgi:hypothetical protein
MSGMSIVWQRHDNEHSLYFFLFTIRMTSLLRSFAVPVGKNTNKFDNISTPSYSDSDFGESGESVPIPFTYSNGVLDINITNSSVQNFVNNGSSPDDETEFQAKFCGGLRLVHTLGNTLTTYLRNRIANNEGISGEYLGDVILYIKPTVTKVQLAQPGDVQGLTFENVYGVNDNPPSSDQYIGGDEANKYYTCWVFKTPMTIKYTSSISTTGYRYMTFSTHYDGD